MSIALPSQLDIPGSVSGSVLLRAADQAGSGTIFKLPSTNGTAGQFLQTDGSGGTSWQDSSATNLLPLANAWSVNGAASTPAAKWVGTWFTGGDATTTKPQLLLEPTGTTSTAWSTSGTAFGINSASGFAGNFIDCQTAAGGSLFKVNSNGQVTTQSLVFWSGPAVLIADAANVLAQRNSTTAQVFRVYNTYTDASNYERFTISWADTANNISLISEKAGTGTARDIIVKTDAGNNIIFRSLVQYFQSSSGASFGNIQSAGLTVSSGYIKSSHATAGIGYDTGAGGTVTQITSRTTGVTLNKASGAITLVSAAGSTTAATFTVTNSAVAATDTVVLSQKSGTDKYDMIVSAVAAGSFDITFRTYSGTTTEQPVFNFAVIKAVAA